MAIGSIIKGGKALAKAVAKDPLDDALHEVMPIRAPAPKADPLEEAFDDAMAQLTKAFEAPPASRTERAIPTMQVEELSPFDTAFDDAIAQLKEVEDYFNIKPDTSHKLSLAEDLLSNLGVEDMELFMLDEATKFKLFDDLSAGKMSLSDLDAAVKDSLDPVKQAAVKAAKSPEQQIDDILLDMSFVTSKSDIEDWSLDDKVITILDNKLSHEQINLLTTEQKLEISLNIFEETDRTSLVLAQAAGRIQRDFDLPFVGTGSSSTERDIAATIWTVRTNTIRDRPRMIDERLDAVMRAKLGDSQAHERISDIANAVSDTYLMEVQKLSALEMASLNFYTHRGDTAVNKALREGIVELGTPLDSTITFMNQTLDKLPPHEGIVYRNAGKEVFDMYTVGEEVVEKGFTSSTLARLGPSLDLVKEATVLPFDKTGYLRNRTVFVINSKTGRNIEMFTEPNYLNEREVLFKSGTRFRVVDKDELTHQIYLEEI